MQNEQVKDIAIRALAQSATQLSYREGVELYSYLNELEHTINLLTRHLAELESAMATLDNELAVRQREHCERLARVAAHDAEKSESNVGPGSTIAPEADVSVSAHPARSKPTLHSSTRPDVLFRLTHAPRRKRATIRPIAPTTTTQDASLDSEDPEPSH